MMQVEISDVVAALKHALDAKANEERERAAYLGAGNMNWGYHGFQAQEAVHQANDYAAETLSKYIDQRINEAFAKRGLP